MSELAFDFDFSGTDRQRLLGEADDLVRGLGAYLGDTEADEVSAASARLLRQLNEAVAEWGAYPDVVELERTHFTERGLAVPTQFEQLSERYRFYWLRFPLTLSPAEGLPFRKLAAAIEFNPGAQNGHRRPRAHLILPDQKFKSLLDAQGSIELQIGESFEFEVGLDRIDVALPHAQAAIGGKVDAKQAAKVGVVAGPFTYSLKKAQLTHSPPKTEKVFWQLDGTEFLREEEPTLITVMQVPREVDEVRIAAAMQVSNKFSVAEAGLGNAIRYFGQRVGDFFRKGAPIQDETEWNITPSL